MDIKLDTIKLTATRPVGCCWLAVSGCKLDIVGASVELPPGLAAGDSTGLFGSAGVTGVSIGDSVSSGVPSLFSATVGSSSATSSGGSGKLSKSSGSPKIERSG